MTDDYSELTEQTRLVPFPEEPDACDVLVADGALVWVFHFTRIQPDYSHLHASVGLEWLPAAASTLREGFDLPRARFSPLHVDWRSGSSRETLERRVRNYYDPTKKSGVPWARLIEFAADRLDEFLLQTGDLEPPTLIENPEHLVPDYLIRPLWPQSRRPVVWYGQGEAGKGVMAIAAGFSLCAGVQFCNLRTKSLPLGLVYVDYEDDFDEFNVRVNRYANGLYKAPVPNLRRFDPHGRLFVDIVHTLKAKVDAMGGCDGYVIDSAIPACGGDVLKPEPVGAFFQALALLGKPAIVIAHETKEGPTSADAPFGSQLWRTSSCMTVNFQGSSEPRRDPEGTALRDVLIRCTKANNVPRFNPVAFELSFSPDAEGRNAAQLIDPTPYVWTRIRQINPTDVSQDLTGKLTATQQLVVALRDGALTLKDLAAATGLNPRTIQTALRRDDAFISDGGGQGAGKAAVWRLRGHRNGGGPE